MSKSSNTVGGILQGPIRRRAQRAVSRATHACADLENVLVQAREKWSHLIPREGGVAAAISDFMRDFTRDIYGLFSSSGFKVHCDGRECGYVVLSDERAGVSGIVIDAIDNFRVVVQPLADVSRDARIVEDCLANIAEYDVWEAIDGTRITMHYSARFSRWMMATPRAYDVSEKYWIGARTFAQHLEAAFAEVSRKAEGSESLRDILDKSQIYTFFMHCPDFHPLAPTHYQLLQADGPPIAGIAEYAKLGAIPPAEVMMITAQDSLREYCQAIASRAESVVPHHGYIMRLRDTSIAARRNLPIAAYLESSLHEFVRASFYDIPQVVRDLNEKSRETYLHVRAYISHIKRLSYLLIFPRAVDVYRRMDLIIEVLTDLTVKRMRAAKKDVSTSVSDEREKMGASLFGSSWVLIRERLITTSGTIAAKMTTDDSDSFGSIGGHIRANVRDNYLDPVNILTYVNILMMS
jgi:hypothetical protein